MTTLNFNQPSVQWVSMQCGQPSVIIHHDLPEMGRINHPKFEVGFVVVFITGVFNTKVNQIELKSH